MPGASLFAEQLRGLGHAVVVDGDWVELDYVAPGGTYGGTQVRLALQVQSDFPLTPPSGIDFKPRMPGRPVNQSGEHPARSAPSRRFGEGGEYWSRPHAAWNTEPVKDARTYLVWVNTLWMST